MTEQSKQVCSLLQAAQKDWNPPTLPQKAADMPQGDMPGDAVHISEAHRTKADAIFPLLLPQLAEICARNPSALMRPSRSSRTWQRSAPMAT